MSDGELLFYVFLGGFAVAMGVLSAFATTNRGKNRCFTIFGPIFAAILLPLVCTFLMGFSDWNAREDSEFLDSIRSGFAAALVYGPFFALGCAILVSAVFGITFGAVRMCGRSIP